MSASPVTVSVEMAVDDEPVRGKLLLDVGRNVEFVGWRGLVAALLEVRESSREPLAWVPGPPGDPRPI